MLCVHMSINQLVYTQSWLEPELDLLPIKYRVATWERCLRVVQKIGVQGRKFCREDLGFRQKSAELVTDTGGNILVLVLAERCVPALLIGEQCAESHFLGK